MNRDPASGSLQSQGLACELDVTKKKMSTVHLPGHLSIFGAPTVYEKPMLS